MILLYDIKRRLSKATEKDKLLHFIASQLLFVTIFICLTVLNIQHALVLSIIIAWSIGLIIEVLDYVTGKGNAEVSDLLANTAGIIAVAVPLVLVL
jgi:glycopeptide antibiotics resistance protein